MKANSTINIGVAGIAGRMGRQLAQACMEKSVLSLSAATEVKGSPVLGKDVGVFLGVAELGVIIREHLQGQDFDVLIDFTRPEATLVHLDACVQARKAIVIGTTGFDEKGKVEIARAAESIAVVFAPNMSIGVNLCLKLLQTAARVMGDDVDVEITEAHHRHKVDAPSGTALRMGEVVAQARGKKLSDCAAYNRQGTREKRRIGDIGFSVIRAGEIIGDHTVLFASPSERIEVTHKAQSRGAFVDGALRAAQWVADKKHGLYDMHDVLGLKE